MNTVSFSKFKDCLDIWSKQNEKGTQCLTQQELGQPSTELEEIVNKLRQALDTMLEEYVAIVSQLGLEETLEQVSAENIPSQVILMRNCVNMYDQEFMVKASFATQQHLYGSIALWKSESYLDDEVQQQIKQLN
ncbi:uncharacterized protein B0P05DRAFT_581559 [Gilbertella persicaria]|uniref:uncharacterized protein n=1 Tax=Gilbertella persicaria TaxID=101096 RepID=UPI00221FF3E4|nr:uncharacterized protein B0P05DRAFT_581559 [Gilbertella persicaria]KAI8058673.1 hypothetical protein B0P05DRAFT_581559 [Gilbertella persicaria]